MTGQRASYVGADGLSSVPRVEIVSADVGGDFVGVDPTDTEIAEQAAMQTPNDTPIEIAAQAISLAQSTRTHHDGLASAGSRWIGSEVRRSQADANYKMNDDEQHVADLLEIMPNRERRSRVRS